jgi:hypothetical protein
MADRDPGHLRAARRIQDLRDWKTLFDTVSRDAAWHFIDTDMDDHPHRFCLLTPKPVTVVDE